jgi:cyclophilin family peptidyl-prolyl cis-trans isomerase/HEAT repeat protein
MPWLLVLVLAAQAPQPPAANAGPLTVFRAENAGAGPDVLLELANSPNDDVRALAVRALGRLEDPSVASQLVFFLHTSRSPRVQAEVVSAMAQSMMPVDGSTAPDQVRDVFRWITSAKMSDPVVAHAVDRAVGRLRFGRLEDADAARSFLTLRLMYEPAVAARALESLARRNQKLLRFDNRTIDALTAIVRRTAKTGDADARRNALSALLSARALDAETQAAAVDDPSEEVRRLAVAAAAGAANVLAPDTRNAVLYRALSDPSALVRYEAVRGYARISSAESGCRPLLAALGDSSPHVALAAIDALGEACLDDESATTRLTSELHSPPTMGSWHREAHALVAMAKRDPARATLAMPAFASHEVWQVRMYAARAAAAMKDVETLKRLAADRDDNVADAALQPLHTLDPNAAAPLIEAALKRTDPQLLRTAALLLKEMPASPSLAAPILDALQRLTKSGVITSRDARLALLDALKVYGGTSDLKGLTPLLQDIDAAVAEKAADVMAEGLGTAVHAEPKPDTPRAIPEFNNLDTCVSVALGSGGRFRIAFRPDVAPLATGHFLRLALHDEYYDGLTFHRIVPNFVIQGGSPGANEYAGARDFMRDEVGADNERGTVGLSTRGRHTGDSQIFINLVDNPRLDFEFTVFGAVFPEDLPVVDRITEGETISDVTTVACTDNRR